MDAGTRRGVLIATLRVELVEVTEHGVASTG